MERVKSKHTQRYQADGVTLTDAERIARLQAKWLTAKTYTKQKPRAEPGVLAKAKMIKIAVAPRARVSSNTTRQDREDHDQEKQIAKWLLTLEETPDFQFTASRPRSGKCQQSPIFENCRSLDKINQHGFNMYSQLSADAEEEPWDF